MNWKTIEVYLQLLLMSLFLATFCKFSTVEVRLLIIGT